MSNITISLPDGSSRELPGGSTALDLAASIGDIDGHWEVAVVGKNVGDKRVVSTSGGRPFRGAGDDEVYNLNRGRQIFLEGSVRF